MLIKQKVATSRMNVATWFGACGLVLPHNQPAIGFDIDYWNSLYVCNFGRMGFTTTFSLVSTASSSEFSTNNVAKYTGILA